MKTITLPKTKPIENPNPSEEKLEQVPEVVLEDSSLTATARIILEKYVKKG